MAKEHEDLERKEGENRPNKIEKKIICTLCYLWGILFFIPLILYREDTKTRKHANEGLVLLILTFLGGIIFRLLGLLGGVMATITTIFSFIYFIALLLLGIIGIIWVWREKDEPLPLIGQIHLIR